uniref:AAA domain-containing protein n=1 Tax=Angiostrongylus cantonensis TaxID=6313 RepID=A0A158P9A0_ANGCA
MVCPICHGSIGAAERLGIYENSRASPWHGAPHNSIILDMSDRIQPLQDDQVASGSAALLRQKMYKPHQWLGQPTPHARKNGVPKIASKNERILLAIPQKKPIGGKPNICRSFTSVDGLTGYSCSKDYTQLFSIGRHEKLKKRKDSLAGYPPEFRAKLQLWPKLLQAEIDESVSHLKQLREVKELSELEERGLLIASLRLRSDELHPITGRTVILKRVFLAHLSDRSKVFRAGTPATIRDAKTLEEIAECVILASDRKDVKVKVRHSNALAELNSDTEYILTLSQSSGALHSVKDFFLKNKVVGTAGVDLLGYAFRAKIMPSIHNDRMITGLSSDLNDNQRRAVSAALNKRRPFVIIQGPPGTGKTRVVAEIVKQLCNRKLKTLVCAPSNVAVDKVMSEVMKLFSRIYCNENSTSEMDDEAAQGSEPIAWTAIAQAKRCILTGDHAQLPCTVLSPAYVCSDFLSFTFKDFARQGNLQVSLMERLVNEFSNQNINQLLTVQYRMNEKIMHWSSKEFYDSRLVASEEVSKITLSDISLIADTSKLNSPLVMINTDLDKRHGDRFYKEVSFQMSYKNPGEQ